MRMLATVLLLALGAVSAAPAPSPAPVAAPAPAPAATPVPTPAPVEQWQENRHYLKLPAKVASQARKTPGKVEVMEVFWYGCSHCRALEPYLRLWQTKKANYVQFVKVPVAWEGGHQVHARLFYTLEAMGRPELHAVVFQEFQTNQQMLMGRNLEHTERLMADFAKRQGLDPDAFLKTFRSPEVVAKVQEADALTRRYLIENVPTLIVGGKYLTNLTATGSPPRLLQLIDYLAAMEHAANK